MTSAEKTGLAALALAVPLGIWLFVAPFLLEYAGSPWSAAAKNHVILGLVVAGLAAAALVAYAARAVREALAAAPVRAAAER